MSSEIFADILHGRIGVTVADVYAASGGGSQSTLSVTREALLEQRCFFIHLMIGRAVLHGCDADALVPTHRHTRLQSAVRLTATVVAA